MPDGHYRPGAGNFRQNNHCRNGHDVAQPSALVEHKGSMVCRQCLRDARRRYADRRKSLDPYWDECQRCGKSKYGDARAYCGPCRHVTRGERARTPAQIDAALIEAIVLETAPAWVRNDPAEHAAWIAHVLRSRRA